MPADNVTPFRRPPPKRTVAPQQQGGLGLKTHRGRAVLSHILTLAAYALAFLFPSPPLSFVALAVAIGAFVFVYSNRDAGMPWANTHHEHALRTLIIGYSVMTLADVIVMVVLTPLTPPNVAQTMIVVAFWLKIAVIVWAGLRALIALALAVLRRAVPHTKGWLV